jgi:short-subunit dehydrogenase
MAYIVTGGTGFIGKHLIDRLVQRGEPIHVIVRESSAEALHALAEKRWPAHKHLIHPLLGDITAPLCGVGKHTLEALHGKVAGVFHLAAIYDMAVDAEAAQRANVDGTRHALDVAEALGCTFHHVSSIAVTGGVVQGVFDETMFDVGQKLDHPYYQTKFEAEALVRRESHVPYRIYRPGVVVGSSVTGEADKIDGPYYAFPFIKLARKNLPHWMPLLGTDGGILNIVPVDYVARAIDALAHSPGLDGQAFHLVGPNAPTMLEAMRVFSEVAGGPKKALTLPRKLLSFGRKRRKRTPLAQAVRQGFMEKTGIPESVLDASDWVTRFDTSRARAVLEPMGIDCPELPAYARVIWEYWEEHLVHMGRAKRGRPQNRGVLTRGVRNKRVLITGASSGIGEAVAKRVAKDGGIAILVARSEEKLKAVRAQIEAAGGRAEHFLCDLSDPAQIETLLETLADEPPIDVLVNNAGRSIRRSLSHSYDRLHDFERTMQLNYFGALHITMGLLPGMRARRNGHIINISSAGVLIATPRFAAYVASKAAFDAFSRVAAGEVLSDNVHFTTVYMPLVRTPMIAPTKGYENAPALTPEQAADWVVGAIDGRPENLTGHIARAMQAMQEVRPSMMNRLRNIGYRFTPGSSKTRNTPPK